MFGDGSRMELATQKLKQIDDQQSTVVHSCRIQDISLSSPGQPIMCYVYVATHNACIT